ncbi:MAG: restriction endonuclease [Candidatus Levybacteria bacterium]|nr:restriction endonuclease [Candidatus Levybacteria bacterium]
MFNVLKASGQLEFFNEGKLRTSIQRAGVPSELQNNAINHIKSKLREGIPTSEIYKHIVEFLGKSAHPFTRAKYSLKQAIMDFGPTGFPFEDYVSELLRADGYQTKVRQILQGKCITHEIDVVAQKNNIKSMIECKFHSDPGIKCHVHVSLYSKARFDDIKEKNQLNDAWVVTNTKLTPEALNYALCSNMKIIGWDYPKGQGLQDIIEKHKLYPITTIANLTQNQKQILAQNHVVMARDICKNSSVLDILGLPADKKNSIVSECQFLRG